MTTITKTEFYTLTSDIPGQRIARHIQLTKDQAFNIARSYLLREGIVTIYDAEDKMVYRHAQPLRRRSHE